MFSLPGLFHLVFGPITWYAEQIPSGGALGYLLGSALEGQLNRFGAICLLLGAVVVGSTLLIQSTFGEILFSWNRKLLDLKQSLVLGWSRRRERRQKERSRRRVMEKHLQRQVEEKGKASAQINRAPLTVGSSEAAGAADFADVELDPPLRVFEKQGSQGFVVRKHSSASERTPEVATGPQHEIPFPKMPKAKGKSPPISLLQLEDSGGEVDEDELVRMGEAIRLRCAEFGVEGTTVGISPGPVITVFEFQPAPGVKVSQIVGLQDDLALALKAEAIRIDRIAGRSTLGIEVPNRERTVIRLGKLLTEKTFLKAPSNLMMALGKTVRGEPYFADLATMPHLLVAGATGSGKSVGLQSMITSMIYKATRDEVQFIFIDPKRIELGAYRKIPYLKTDVVVEPKKAANALKWAVTEMERRYRLLAEVHVRSIGFYNSAIHDPKVQERLALSDDESEFKGDDLKPLPYYVIVIDELADLMMVCSSEVEIAIARLAQMARAVGIHLIVATQRPSVDVLTGTIKANFPCRISYATATRHDSRTILDQIGAEKLLGKGDMLFMAPGTSRVVRLHGAFVSEQETAALVRWLKKQGPPDLDPTVVAPTKEEVKGSRPGGDDDELFDQAARLVVAEGQASASFLQRRLRIGFSRAARLIDIMEQDGLLGPSQGSKPREVLVKKDYFAEIDGEQFQE
jgi:S-DNA-T family DNA segregation ATPase FtsK/SpoIIIE